MKTFLKAASLVLALGFASHANAGLLLEPYLGYESSEIKIGTSTDKVTGPALGLRAGYKMPMMLWFALDYSMITGGTAKNDSGGADDKIDSSNLYFDVGFDLPVLARVWAGYGLARSYKATPDTGSSSEIKLESPLKVGIGFTFLPIVSVNLEYFMSKAKEATVGSATIDYGSYDTRDNNGLILSVSAPFNL
ncbi:MAG: outer membrane beta-barrel protein [Bdellovibrionaceae bacterium]|nr:outer membrane beta-barrel protein [Pseudobdellovibrionaceae bacterium]